ncbi:hypothetical protein [Hymenobacter latericus]|uniref:hypothetical protein n=1 Tax=Hymenobacter sp. YIM 151858-1 TaxID=2987688 RepID=UPI002225BFF2|nr:hypothetical protein [Hymenobacter sp. YIM 151858-1]UYZ60093.1 hypothetical protein OIS50_04655 [Hymenobacter sp. YIM 151858-1]
MTATPKANPNQVFLALTPHDRARVVRHQQKNGFRYFAEAARDLVRIGLKNEGL